MFELLEITGRPIMLNNWVLIKPKRDLFAINESTASGILIDITWRPEFYRVISGTVMACPDDLVYRDKQSDIDLCRSEKRSIEASLEMDVDIDIEIGDEVIFNYNCAEVAVKEEKVWKLNGEMVMLVRYDLLEGVKRDGQWSPLNGWMFFQKIESSQQEKTAGGIIIPKMIQTKFKYIHQQGLVRLVGKPVREYWWHSDPGEKDYYPPHNMILPGDHIMMEQSSDLQLDNEIIRDTELDETWRRVQEKDVMGFFVDGKFMPNRYRVLVKVDPEEKKFDVAVDLEIPDSYRKPKCSGVVIRNSPMRTKFGFCYLEPGDKVIFTRNRPNMHVKINGEDFLVLHRKEFIYGERNGVIF